MSHVLFGCTFACHSGNFAQHLPHALQGMCQEHWSLGEVAIPFCTCKDIPGTLRSKPSRWSLDLFCLAVLVQHKTCVKPDDLHE